LIQTHVLRGVFYPLNFIYPRAARFLLQRPELDVTDVLMLYGMLYGSSDDWKKERGWIVRLCPTAFMGACFQFISALDQALRRAALEVCGANTLVNP
jgi:nucleolar pre-ribosomal-associated protein 1